MGQLTILSSEHITSVPPSVRDTFHSLPDYEKANQNDVVGLVFRFVQGLHDATLSAQVSFLTKIDNTLDDIEWKDLTPTDQARLAPLAMHALYQENGFNHWLSQDISKAWPDTDDSEGVQVCLFHNAIAVMPIDIEDTLAYANTAQTLIISTLKTNSGHDAMIAQKAQTTITSLFHTIYQDHL